MTTSADSGGSQTFPLVAVGGGIVGIAGVSALLHRRRGADDDQSPSVEDSRNKGDGVVEAAESAREVDNYETAVERYSDAVEAYQNAADAASSGSEEHKQIKTALEDAEAARDTVDEIKETIATVKEPLSLGETDLAKANREYARGNETVAEVRYRRAREQFRQAIEQNEEILPIEISIDVAPHPPLDAIPAVTDEVRTALADAELESPEAIRNADRSTLTAIPGVSGKVTTRLTAWADVPEKENHEFETEADIKDRLNVADKRFRESN